MTDQEACQLFINHSNSEVSHPAREKSFPFEIHHVVKEKHIQRPEQSSSVDLIERHVIILHKAEKDCD